MTYDLENLPSYRELPVKPGTHAGSSWGHFGDDDELGTLNVPGGVGSPPNALAIK